MYAILKEESEVSPEDLLDLAKRGEDEFPELLGGALVVIEEEYLSTENSNEIAVTVLDRVPDSYYTGRLVIIPKSFIKEIVHFVRSETQVDSVFSEVAMRELYNMRDKLNSIISNMESLTKDVQKQ